MGSGQFLLPFTLYYVIFNALLLYASHNSVFVITILQYVSGKIFVGSRSGRGYEFGRTYVVRPKGKHQATIVWLHGLGDNGSR